MPARMTSTNAMRIMLAIGYQESGFRHTRQINGPARGYWQFEANGVLGVRGHRATSSLYQRVLESRGIDPSLESLAVCEALAEDHPLAAALARLLLWTHPDPIPPSGEKAWRYYEWLWRPGKPHPERWPGSWERAEREMA